MNKYTIFDYIVGALLVSVTITILLGCFYAFTEIQKDRENYRIQGECIASYINSGVERRDIILVGSTDCEVKK